MKSFLVLLNEKQPDLLNDYLLKLHVDYLRKLHANGHLSICGPFTDNQNAMLVIKANSQTQAEELIINDPFIKERYYKSYMIHEFIEANDENDWLNNAEQTQDNIKISKITASSSDNLADNPPKTISVLFRKLKEGKNYDDFHQAWLPPVKNPQDKASLASYFSGLTQVINAQNLRDPSEIISIGLIWADWEAVQQESKRIAPTEKMRHEHIAKVADKMGETKIYQVIDVDKLGQ